MKKTIVQNLKILLFCFFLGLTSNSFAQQIKTLTNSVGSALGDVIKGKSPIQNLPTAESDRETNRILISLIEQSGWFPSIKVSVVDGMVIIEGIANSKEQLEWLVNSAERLPTVLAVINKVELSATAFTDLSPAISELRRIADAAKRALPNILLALVLFFSFFAFNHFLNRIIKKLWERSISNPFLLATVSKLTLLPIWLLFFYLILRTAGLSSLATTIIGGTGMLGLILGLAFRGIAENYLAGLLLAMRSPFTKGDLIEIGENLGYVQNLSMRGTTIIDLDGNLILIPNSTVIQSVVQNRTANPLTRVSFNIGIGYADSISKAQQLILSALPDVRGVLTDPEPSVLVENFGAASVNLRVLFWFNIKEINQLRVRSRAMIHIKDILLANGITIPDEAREVVFADTLKIQMLDSKEAVTSNQDVRKNKVIEQASVNLEEKKNHTEKPELTQEKNLMRLAEENPLLTERPKDDLLKP